eukprot:TRINITY_DN78632_c0_g1_i1.p1 TRINITY_DN78632_c0_g1~~TRINITY_DN78632_c0_g1_i1.p1  ORF type:complete len:250 (+),score=23.18 TRINITY_DN78632_c0_g1_i1:13-762(+)
MMGSVVLNDADCPCRPDGWRGSVPDPTQMSLRNPAMCSAMHRACMAGDAAVVDILLLNGEDIYKRESLRGYTPLHDAACNGHVSVVGLLLECRADTNVVDFKGYTPFHEAAFMGHSPVVKALLSGGALAEVKAQNGTTPMDWALYSGHQAVMELVNESLQMAELVVTVHASREGDSGCWSIACTLLGGRKVDVSRIDPEQATLAELWSALALELSVPRPKLRLVTASGTLLMQVDETVLISAMLDASYA